VLQELGVSSIAENDIWTILQYATCTNIVYPFTEMFHIPRKNINYEKIYVLDLWL